MDTESQNPEVVALTESETLLAEALEELQTTSRDEAKRVIRERVQEIQRLKTLLAKAESDLSQLIKRPPEEIAMFNSTEDFARRARKSLEGSRWA